MIRRIVAAASVAIALAGTATACTVAGGAEAGTERIVIGYQSKTINTVTAGTLLRAKGYFEQRLAALSKQTGTKYSVEWQDYESGAPITAQMMAGKIDIGSMGDFPLLINGSSGQLRGDTHTRLISVTGYNARGALNSIVTPTGSSLRSVSQLKGKTISTSVGSAAHGLLVRVLAKNGIDPNHDVTIENQLPSIGASALQAKSVDALSQFVAWPGLLVFQKQASLLYDGGQLNVPTLHGVVVRDSWATGHRDVVSAFLRAQLDATHYLWQHPLDAANIVAKATGLPPEVVYLYNGANGIATFDPTLKPFELDVLHADVPFLKSIGVLSNPLDVDSFVDPSYIRGLYGSRYSAAVRATANPAAISGTDPVCHRPVTDVATAGELWLDGASTTQPAANGTCLLKAIRAAQAHGDRVRAAYIPDASTGTRWFADQSIWVDDSAAQQGDQLLPFATPAAAQTYVAAHPGAKQLSYQAALEVA